MRRALAITVLVSGCSGGGDEALTCQRLEDPGNCWAAAAAELAECLPSRATPGTLTADRTACQWSDGTSVTFATPLPTSTFDLAGLDFTVTGAGCSGRFVDTFDNRLELTVGGRTEVSQLLPNGRFELGCSDGTSYQSSFDLLFTCAAGSGPTDGFDVTPSMFTFTLVSAATPGPLFTCTQ